MPLVADSEGWSRARLLALIVEQRSGLAGILEALESPELPVREPEGILTGRDLLQRVLAMTDDVLREDRLPVSMLARLVNVRYDARVAAIDLVKSHSDLEKAPENRI